MKKHDLTCHPHACAIAFGTGYGLNMLTTGVRALLDSGEAWGNGITRETTAAVLMAAYGARLVFFLTRRQRSAAYATKMNDLRTKTNKLSIFARLGIAFAVGCTQTLYCLPLLVVAKTDSAAGSSGLLRDAPVSSAAAGVALFGLLLETAADEQKTAAKHANPTVRSTA